MVFWLVQLSQAAQAQTLRLALFKTATSSAEHSQLAAALDPVLQAQVGRVPQVSVAAVPSLDLPSLQLALDCVGETPSCLSVATERSKVDGLLSPSLARSGATLVLSFLLYNPHQSSPLKIVTRSFATDASEAVVIDGAKSLVQELFGLTPAQAPAAPEPQPVTAEREPPVPTPAPVVELDPQLTAASPEPRRSPSLLLPIVLGAAGIGALAIGIGFGVASNDAEASYAGTRIMNPDDAQAASELLSTAHTQTAIANVAFGLGAASCVAAGVVFFLQRRSHKPDTEPNAHVALGPGYLGITGGF